MKRVLSRSVPWQVAWFAPAVLVTVLYLVAGAEAFSAVVGGLIGGVIGLFGALGFELATVLAARRRDRQLDEALAQLREMQEDKPPER